MDFYHNWLYEYVLNTKWFLWIVVGAIFSINIVGPLFIWRITSSKTKKDTTDVLDTKDNT
ncbi:hypothetical protein ABC255_06430 [Neobacillus sp. 3P2-tot-E-2]|uniref:hypothetical protein n=1 Tax=Neobacillus sp. 3P2-tot-E-2 TaxID=3132212 RepID=UPI00399FFA3D